MSVWERGRVNGRFSVGMAVLVISSSLPHSGCGDDLLGRPNDRVWESEHFRYHTRATDPVCEGVLQQLERHLAIVQEYLGFTWAAGDKVDYFKYLDADDWAATSPCANHAGCTTDGMILSPEIFQHHELVHAYLQRPRSPPPFFAEGLAVALACENLFTVTTDIPWRDVVTLEPDDRERILYAIAPWFVGHLLRKYGPAPFLELFERLRRDASADEIAAVFSAVYQTTLDDAWRSAQDVGRLVPCLFLWECAGPRLPQDGSLSALAEACDGTGRFQTFELDAEGDAILNRAATGVFSPVSCGDEPPSMVGRHAYTDITELAHLPRGTYFVSPAFSRASVGVRVPAAKVLSTSCGEVEVLDFTRAEFGWGPVEIIVPSDGQAWFVKLRAREANSSIYWDKSATDTSLSLAECDGCDALETCREPPSSGLTPDADDVVTLRLATTSSSGSVRAAAVLFW